MGFDHVKAVTGVDYLQENKMDVVYHASSYEDLELARFFVEVKASVNRSEPKLPTLTSVWPSAEYHERETTDLLGIVFEGHRAVGRLMLPENFEGGPPLRKDFKIKTEGIDA